MSYILVTGGAGYIGTHTVVELLAAGYKVVVVDNLVNASYDAVARVEAIARAPVPFVRADIRDHAALDAVFKQYPIAAVIHFAALKAVGESTKTPLKYYSNNIDGAITLMTVMEENNVKNLVFSSSATVYGDATRFENMIPIPEHCPTGPTSPYGQTKLTVENLIRDVHAGDPAWKAAILRYFNPIGAHPSGLIGEDPLGTPNNLLPYLAQVAVGRREKLAVFGNDYASRDGTPIRDYIHVVDLAKGHLAALRYLEGQTGLCREWNLGSGRGSTVLEVYAAFCEVVGRALPYEIVSRRDGDVLDLTARPSRAKEELKWQTQLTVEDACRDLWKWTLENPFGYQTANYVWDHFGARDSYADRTHTVATTDGRFKVTFTNYGAAIVRATLDGVSLQTGFDLEAGYKLPANPFFGATIGRVANRLADGALVLNGATYSVPLAKGHTHALHGGPAGYDKQMFLGPITTKNEKTGDFRVKFVYNDPHMANGFPGDVAVNVIYTVRATARGGAIDIEYEAELTDQAEETAISMTNHTYWNISGGEDIAGTELVLVSDQQQEVDATLIPTGKFVTNSDVVTFKDVAAGRRAVILGTEEPKYDYCFTAGDARATTTDTRACAMVCVAEAYHPATGITFTTSTTEPSFQIYTGDGVNVPAGELTPGFKSRAGFCVECARFINAAKFEELKPSVVLKKGAKYGAKTEYRFEKAEKY
ncbi:hypothetical protein BABINDRAFT_159550 [Babjeviella inositovora NRRL Y-12698]|uniref:NAD-dependent epimerase/dehydratase domain-containing protein n=1 Tax=Babjeviella inositovora NRRL Y-12698 TaxID=984486 RepID=A0A1E3QZJ1_9ASCO|nr:uncharacterized protein BABINDRAFT_159550 [Babjeviella inositovora NRRL Y-12698]ODQ83093.1 hypothetical protein BABINDRAFT_159550 [Babjeviella inositovora NRRL Y-12698]